MQQQAQEELDPFGTGKLPSGRHGLSREVVVRSQRERMVESMIAVVAMKGYTETTVADIISNAGVSRATFYEQFADKEDCFIAAYGAVMERLLAFVAQGFAIETDDWIVQIRSGIGNLLVYLAHNPVAARVGIVEGFGAGARARDRYQQAVSSFFPFLDAGRAHTPDPDRMPAQTARVIVGGVSALMFNEASEGNAANLPSLLPQMMYVVVVPYLGHEEAMKAMAETPIPE